ENLLLRMNGWRHKYATHKLIPYLPLVLPAATAAACDFGCVGPWATDVRGWTRAGAPSFGRRCGAGLRNTSCRTMRGCRKNRISFASRRTVRRLNNSPRIGTFDTPGVRFIEWLSLSMLMPPITVVPPSATSTVDSAD